MSATRGMRGATTRPAVATRVADAARRAHTSCSIATCTLLLVFCVTCAGSTDVADDGDGLGVGGTASPPWHATNSLTQRLPLKSVASGAATAVNNSSEDGKALPLMVLGAMKGGTTALWRELLRSPRAAAVRRRSGEPLKEPGKLWFRQFLPEHARDYRAQLPDRANGVERECGRGCARGGG